jgi:hypothetical protein
MPERLNGAVLKTAGAAKPPGVRIPLPPHHDHANDILALVEATSPAPKRQNQLLTEEGERP